MDAETRVKIHYEKGMNDLEHYIASCSELSIEIEQQAERIKVLEKEVHTLREREYCDDCSAKTIIPEPHGIGCKAKKLIKELEAEKQKLIESQKAKEIAGS